jgi:hypothetical protein
MPPSKYQKGAILDLSLSRIAMRLSAAASG